MILHAIRYIILIKCSFPCGFKHSANQFDLEFQLQDLCWCLLLLSFQKCETRLFFVSLVMYMSSSKAQSNQWWSPHCQLMCNYTPRISEIQSLWGLLSFSYLFFGRDWW